MHDWQELVRTRLKEHEPKAETSEHVICELAAHLEETYEAARSQRLTDAAAVELTLQQVQDWRVLAREIQRAKSKEGPLNARTKSLWLPAMITLLGASLSVTLIQFAGLHPRLVWFGHMAMLFYWHWLATLPAFGALGAYLSQRAHGSILARFASATSPALVMLATMFVILPFGLARDGFSFFRLVYFGLGITNWVALPGIALLAGATPFLRDRNQLATTES